MPYIFDQVDQVDQVEFQLNTLKNQYLIKN